jgi:hypothetical protein
LAQDKTVLIWGLMVLGVNLMMFVRLAIFTIRMDIRGFVVIWLGMKVV